MKALIVKIRDRASELLSSGEVEMVIGFTRGRAPMSTTPFIARTPEEANLLHWDDFCVMNLVNFIPQGRSGRAAIVAKGCDARSLVVYSRENGTEPDSFVVLGITCRGMLDASKIRRAVGRARIVKEVTVCDDNVVRVCGEEFEEILNLHDCMRTVCLACRHPKPVLFDELYGEGRVASPLEGMDAWRSAIQNRDPEERLAFFRNTFRHCISCLACRQACPACSCEQCFLDRNKALWMHSVNGSRIDSLGFHMTRAFHLAGRCTDCGACESVCPMNIPVRTLARMLNWDIERKYAYEAGVGELVPVPVHLFDPAVHERKP